MGGGTHGAVLRHLGRLFSAGTLAGLGEGELLERFVTRRDEVAFEALAARFGPMVLAVCRRMLDDPRDIEDAFQATFLILVRKAGAIRHRDALGPWLHGVAYRVARRARAAAIRRQDREPPTANLEPVDPSPTNPAARAELDELRPVLDDELNRLPGKYRDPIVLCHLEGLSHEQAAAQLGCPVGTVRSRLARGREKLRTRLIRRGIVPSAAALSAALSSGSTATATVPPTLLNTTLKAALALLAGSAAATGVISTSTTSLMKGVLTAMFLSQLKTGAVVVLTTGALTAGVATGVGVFAGPPGEPSEPPPETPKASAPQEPEKAEDPSEQPEPQPDLKKAEPSFSPPREAPSERKTFEPPDRLGARPISPREIEVRLKHAKQMLVIREQQFKSGALSTDELAQSHFELDLLKAQLVTLRDELRDELELLQAQRAIKHAELMAADVMRDSTARVLARHRQFMQRSVNPDQIEEATSTSETDFAFHSAQRDVKEAEMMEVQTRIEHAQRRLRELDRLIKEYADEAADDENADSPPADDESQ